MLSLRDIVVSRGRRTVLNGLTASADKGDVVAILGPNGCGKTTLLHFVAGALKGNSGDIYCEDRRIDTSSLEWRRTLSYVLDDGGTIPLLTVEEQIYLQSVLAGVDRGKASERTAHVLELLDLSRFRDYRGEELSSGVRKRLGIGLGIVREADVFLFDEPFSSLDVQATAVFGRILQTLKNRGRIVLVASHSFPFHDGLYNRLWSLSAGVVVERSNEREVRECLARPSPAGGLKGPGEIELPWILQSA
jgi:ABC-type multidrug transport system ATPase subunit